MTSATFARPEKFQIGRVFNNSFSVIGRNIVLTVGLALLFSGLPTVLMQLWTESRMQAILAVDPGAAADPAFAFRNSWISFVAIFISSIFALLLQSALVRATIEDLNGKRPTFGDSLQIAIRFLLPTLGIGFLVALGSGLAMIALIVPGIILWLGWSVSVPVLIQERLGVVGSMSRSRALTKGSRWSLFGLFLVLIIIAMVIQGAAGVVVYLFHGIAAAIVAGLVQSVMSMLLSVAAAVSYVELRQVKEGTSVDELAEIFS
jgi:multisubunit Na+/H+ antiporter MnhG subunit